MKREPKNQQNTIFRVHFSVFVENVVGDDLHFSKLFGGQETIGHRWYVFVCPWTAVLPTETHEHTDVK